MKIRVDAPFESYLGFVNLFRIDHLEKTGKKQFLFSAQTILGMVKQISFERHAIVHGNLRRSARIQRSHFIIENIRGTPNGFNVVHLCRQFYDFGVVPSHNSGASFRLFEMPWETGFLCEQEEHDEFVELDFQAVLLSFCGGKANFIRTGLVRDLDCQTTLSVAKISSRKICLLCVQIDWLPAKQRVERSADNRLKNLVSVSQPSPRTRLDDVSQQVEFITQLGCIVLTW